MAETSRRNYSKITTFAFASIGLSDLSHDMFS